MQILITGSRGYIGMPLVYELSKLHNVIGVDNLSRENWVRECTGKKENYLEYPDIINNTIIGDLTDREFVKRLLAIHKPRVIIHLASQPSMPYSDMSGERASFTQVNNLTMCLNLLWAIKELDLNTRLVITTTTGIPGQRYKVIPEEPVINSAGSWYHVTRGFDSTNCALAAKQFGIETLELRTSIVYGVKTSCFREEGFKTRFDTDRYFGTAINRFVKQAIDSKSITVYGKGLQTKPFISLEDTIASLINSISYKMTSKHEIMNQVTDHISIKDLAKLIGGKDVIHIDNPRKENETFNMKFKNTKFLKLLGRKPSVMKSEIEMMKSDIGGVIWFPLKNTLNGLDNSITFST